MGTYYEISEELALKKIKGKQWISAWDDYYQRPRDDAWYNMKDPERDWIFVER